MASGSRRRAGAPSASNTAGPSATPIKTAMATLTGTAAAVVMRRNVASPTRNQSVRRQRRWSNGETAVTTAESAAR